MCEAGPSESRSAEMSEVRAAHAADMHAAAEAAAVHAAATEMAATTEAAASATAAASTSGEHGRRGRQRGNHGRRDDACEKPAVHLKSSLSQRGSRRSRASDEENARSPSTYKCARF